MATDTLTPSQHRQTRLEALLRRWQLSQLALGKPAMAADFAEAAQIMPSQLAHHKAGKPIGKRLARQMEAAAGVETGWLDLPHQTSEIEPLELEKAVPALLSAMGPGAAMTMPMMENRTPAGFPSPAEDYLERPFDMSHHLGLDRPHCFLARVRGQSMTGKGIDDGDLIVVNKKLTPRHGQIVVAIVDNELTCKTLYTRDGVVKLQAANSDFEDIVIKEGQELTVWGVVTSVVKSMG